MSFANEAEEAAYAKRMLGRADKILALVDEAFIVKAGGHEFRAMPTFRHEEISLGQTLGTGGFGIVNAITKFSLDEDMPPNNSDEEETKEQEGAKEQQGDDEKDKDKDTENASKSDPVSNGEEAEEEVDDEKDKDKENATKSDPAVSNGEEKVTSAGTDTTTTTTTTTTSTTEGTDTKRSLLDHQDDHNHHYDIEKARDLMCARVTRNGYARYALKRLHNDLTELERARGMIDLAVEAKYLSLVWHPNIIKMRGMCTGPLVSDDFFIILDRLCETLDKRMRKWHIQNKKNMKGICFGLCKKKQPILDLMVERMMIAYDLAAAFFYLHENRIVYRDIKPENIGFDLRGDVKVFDFGLCKSLNPKAKARATEENAHAYGYRLTGRAGSLPYMAPEVAKMETYDTKCDVFSFAILLWEMLACRGAFYGFSSTEFMERVAIQNERPPVDKSWPPLTRLMMPEAWDVDPRKRPDMKRVAILIRGDLNDMTNDDRVLHRTRHLQNRSQHSLLDLNENHDLDDVAANAELK